MNKASSTKWGRGFYFRNYHDSFQSKKPSAARQLQHILPLQALVIVISRTELLLQPMTSSCLRSLSGKGYNLTVKSSKLPLSQYLNQSVQKCCNKLDFVPQCLQDLLQRKYNYWRMQCIAEESKGTEPKHTGHLSRRDGSQHASMQGGAQSWEDRGKELSQPWEPRPSQARAAHNPDCLYSSFRLKQLIPSWPKKVEIPVTNGFSGCVNRTQVY